MFKFLFSDSLKRLVLAAAMLAGDGRGVVNVMYIFYFCVGEWQITLHYYDTAQHFDIEFQEYS